MQTTSGIKLYSLDYSNVRTYALALLFIMGNIVLPQMIHFIPGGGLIWLPIYMFTLVGAYKYGWKVGLLTAIFSPLVNSYFFGMPPVHALPAIMLKSTILAVLAGITASHFKKASLLMLAIVVLGYQALGTLGEWAMKGDFFLAAQDFRIGIPGILLQIFGGWLIINKIVRK